MMTKQNIVYSEAGRQESLPLRGTGDESWKGAVAIATPTIQDWLPRHTSLSIVQGPFESGSNHNTEMGAAPLSPESESIQDPGTLSSLENSHLSGETKEIWEPGSREQGQMVALLKRRVPPRTTV